MKVTFGTEEMEVNTINDVMDAQNKLLDNFANNLIGTKESIRDEVVNDILSHTNFTSIVELTDWLDGMANAGYLGRSDYEIEEKVIHDALSDSDYISIEDMQDRIDCLESTLHSIKDYVDDIL